MKDVFSDVLTNFQQKSFNLRSKKEALFLYKKVVMFISKCSDSSYWDIMYKAQKVEEKLENLILDDGVVW